MFCSKCGGKLPEGVRFCIHCGTPLEVRSAPVPPVDIPAPQESVDLQPDYTEIPQEEPVYTSSPEPEVIVYSDAPAEPAPKKKKKKTGLIVAIVLILVLAIGGGAAFYLYSQHQANVAAYDEAVALLEDGKYDDALAAFQALGDFQDAAKQAAELEELQEDYDAAKKLLEEHEFEEAAEAFTELGDYRDSANYVANEITYQKALYIKSFADARDASGRDKVSGNDYQSTGLNLGDDEAVALLYAEAFDLFVGMGNYADAENLASECCREVAMILLNAKYYDNVLTMCTDMNEADAAAVKKAYEDICADGKFLKDIAEAYVLWYDNDGLYTAKEETEMAKERVKAYVDQHFASAQLKGYLSDFIDALDVMNSACSDDGVEGWVTYYEGMAQIYAVADKLYQEFGVFTDNTEQMELFVGYTNTVATYPVIEESLTDWYATLTEASVDEDGNSYVSYTNNTGFEFTLTVVEDFYDEYDYWIDDSGEIEIYVAHGETVKIPIKPAIIADDEWSSCRLTWWFDVESLD